MEQLWSPIAAVESITCLRKVSLKMFCRNSTMRSSEDCFGIGNKPVGPRQQMTCHFGISKDNSVMFDPFIGCRFAIRLPAIRTDLLDKKFFVLRSNSQPFQKMVNSVSGNIRYNLCVGKPRSLLSFFVSIDRNGDQNRRFPLTPTAPFPSRRCRAEKRFVQLHKSCQTISRVSLSHCLPYLMCHDPDRLVIFNGKFSPHLRYRYARLRSSHSIDQPKPLPEGNLRPMKNCPCRNRYLVMARSALIQASALKSIILTVVAPRTLKTLWPPNLEQILQTLIVRTKLVLKLKQRHCLISHLLFPWRQGFPQGSLFGESCQ
jgi:hypothetical protein